ncbi:winged helix-turn-helix domain-containing protein [Pantoea stewartii]|uniref:winged helix-turn-helix domain-containing protein n=1 Tax=Pantoea stewartii TaxID=66269 RepID=UPI000797582F|nr:winged helix-turn-helix domain-containing protein [Pantoea stewartii]KTS25192.1 transcriptional regulator [Pantoea stewartii]
MSRKIILNGFFVFEPDKKRITGRGSPAVISASASLCLELLIENAGQLVTHQQFYDYVWRRFGTEPASTTLYQNISALRRAFLKAGLKEDIIRTMPRKGFLLSPKTTVDKEVISLSLPLNTVTQDDKGVPELATNNPEPDIAAEGVQISQDEPKTEAESRQLLRSCRVTPQTFSAFFWSKKFLALTSLIALTALFFNFSDIRSGQNDEDALFTYSTHYKGCTLFSRTDALMSTQEVIKRAEQLGVDCKASPFVYLTVYKKSDRLSYFTCQHPLDSRVKANCYSFYYIKNFNDE